MDRVRAGWLTRAARFPGLLCSVGRRRANKRLSVTRGRWISDDDDALYLATNIELDPVKRVAMLIRMNDLVFRDHAVIPVVYRPSVSGIGNGVVPPLSGWDLGLSGLADWCRAG